MNLASGEQSLIFLMSKEYATASNKYYTNSIYLPAHVQVEFVTATYFNGSVNTSVTGNGFAMQRSKNTLQFYCTGSVLAGKAITVTFKFSL